MQNEKTVVVHKSFEMGDAPYRFIGIYSMPSPSLGETNPNAYNGAMASMPTSCRGMCDHCGMGIMHHYVIRDAQGNDFAVGSKCIEQIDDVENMTEVARHEKLRQQQIRQAKREATREKQRVAREAKMQEQREANGGLTDYEVEQEARKVAQEAASVANAEKFAYFIDHLGNEGFAGELAQEMRENGTLPYGRGESIMLDMIAKTAGRGNSKAYNAKYAEAEQKLFELKG